MYLVKGFGRGDDAYADKLYKMGFVEGHSDTTGTCCINGSHCRTDSWQPCCPLRKKEAMQVLVEEYRHA